MRYIYFLLLLIAAFPANAQKETDLILKLDLTSIAAIVDEIGDKEITYFLATDTARKSPLRIARSKVWKIVFANNDIEIINTPVAATAPEETRQNEAVQQEKPLMPEKPKKPVTTSDKRNNRLLAGGSLTREDFGYGTSMGPYRYHSGFKVGYERFAFQKKNRPGGKKSNAGLGVELNNFFEYYQERSDFTLKNDSYTGSKHFLSPYIFREFDIKNIITLGLQAGPFASLAWVKSASNNDINPNKSAVKMGGGLHSGEYIQKYLAKDRFGRRTLYIRVGLDQYLIPELGFNSSFSISFGF
nr:hypothetical protein [uncultured Dyadobacter sp.]